MPYNLNVSFDKDFLSPEDEDFEDQKLIIENFYPKIAEHQFKSFLNEMIIDIF